MGRGSSWRRWVAFGAVCLLGLVVATPSQALDPPGEAVEQADESTTAVNAPSGATTASVPDLASLGWVPVLDEEFDGSTLDETVWQVREGPGLRGGQYTRDAVRIEEHPDEPGSSMLSLTAYTENGQHYGGTIQTGNIDSPLASGFRSAYGYMEARIELNDGLQSEAAFWTMPATSHPRPYGDPAEGGPEIDIMESVYRPDGDTGVCDSQSWLRVPCNERHRANLHWGGFEEGRGWDHTWFANPSPEPLQHNFHLFSLLWTPEGYRFYQDGIEVYRSEHAISYGLEHLILGQYVRPAGLPSNHDYGSLETSSTKLMVDYVKVWQRPISDVPDQSAGQGEPLAVPFTVTDYAYADRAHDAPGSVRVSATSSDQSVVADDQLVVTGNGPADPDGSFQNGSFGAGDIGWSFPLLDGLDNSARIWSGEARSSPNSLRLEQTGGRAEQTITGLQPNTRYMIGGWYNIDLDWNDANGNGKVDDCIDSNGNGRCDNDEMGGIFPDGDGSARFEWGIEDVDATLPGDQTERVTRQRNGWNELNQWWSVHDDTWLPDTILFTTGPDTTEVTVYIDNTKTVDLQPDADLSFDDLYLQPVVPANRTVSMRPETGASGDTTITLTAVDADGQTLGTEQFTVTVADSSFTNGGFESEPVGHGWDFAAGGTEVVIDDPFTLDRMLELARDADGTLYQPLVGLQPGTDYVLEASGRVEVTDPEADLGKVGVAVNGHGGDQAGLEFTTEDWATKTTTFHTGSSSTAANLFVIDWSHGADPEAWSMIDDIRIYPAQPDGPVADVEVPLLADLDELQLPSTSPAAVSFDAPGATISGVESDNPHLLPAENVAVTGSGDEYVLSLTPVPERTGEARVKVFTNSGHTAWQEITVVVSERHFRNPGFEAPWTDGWTLSGGAAVSEGTGQRSGERALELPDGATAVQELSRTTVGTNAQLGLPCNTPYVIGGWASGNVKLTVNSPAGTGGTIEWTGGGWSDGQTTFASPGCYYRGSQPFQITVEKVGASSEPAYVDDLYIFYAPKMSTIRDISVHQGQTAACWLGESENCWPHQRDFHIGHINDHAVWDPSLVTVTSSDDTVLPEANVNLTKPGEVWSDLALMHTWRLQVVAGTKTGRSDITVAVTDPATGVTTKQTFTVTVNAGTSLDNGDFQRNLAGWKNVASPSRDLRNVYRTTLDNPPPTDYDQVLRISRGGVRYRVGGLDANTRYVLSARARGDGSSLVVRGLCLDPECEDDGDPAGAPIITQASVSSPNGWSPVDLSFTTGPEETAVWVFIEDGQATATGSEPCVTYQPGESCYDDIALFRDDDVP